MFWASSIRLVTETVAHDAIRDDVENRPDDAHRVEDPRNIIAHVDKIEKFLRRDEVTVHLFAVKFRAIKAQD